MELRRMNLKCLPSSLALAAFALTALITPHIQAAERVFACRNWVDRDWPRTLLHYDIDAAPGEFVPGRTELLDPAGTPVEHQVEASERHPDGSLKQGRVSFHAALAKDAAWLYTLRSADAPAAFAPRVTSRSRGWLRIRALEVASPEAGVLLPPPGEHAFRRPIDAAEVQPPILGWRLADGSWVGKSRLESDRRVTGWSQRVVADGALYKEYAYEVRFAPGEPPRDTPGYYRARVRIEAEQPLVFVAEEYDFGCITAGRDFLVLTLNDGWKPDTAVWSAYRPTASKPEQVRASRVENDACVWREPLDFVADREVTRLFPHNDFGQHTQWYGLFAEAGATESPFVGTLTLHTGAWRLPGQSASPITWTRQGEVQARLRLSVNLGGMPSNPFNTAEIDPDLPQTLGRRMWALALGPRPARKADGKALDVETLDGWRAYTGFITLNDYKEWTLDWPEDRSIVRPRVFTTPEHLARLKAAGTRCPGWAAIQSYSLLTGDAAAAEAEGRRALQRLTEQQGVLNWYMTHYRQTQNAYEPAFLAESALASPALPDELRRRLRANLALFCHLWSHADFVPRGAAMHMGNPNMPINRFMALPLFAALIPDHPQAKAWLDESYAYLKWKVAFNIGSAGGMFRETLPYATYGPSIFFTTAAIALRNAGYDSDAFEPLKDFGRYLNAVDTPVTAVRGRPPDRLVGLNDRQVRVLPGLMRGSDVAGGQSRMMLASLTAKRDPAYAAEMMGAFQEAGGFLGTEMTQPFMWFYWDTAITPVTPSRRESTIAGLGGILRAHVGTPDEAYLALRMGNSQQRGTDQACIAFYARGACLVPPSGLSAGHSQEGIWPHSVVAFGDPPAGHEHGRVDTNIEDYGFLPSVGYLLGRQTFKGRGPQLRKIEKEFESLPDAFDIIWSRQFQELDESFIYSRQTLLLRSPSPTGPTYVVLRDSTQGLCPLPSRWHLWLNAAADRVTPIPGGVRVQATNDVVCDVLLVEPAAPQIAVTAVTPIRGYAETYSQARVTNDPGKGYLAVLFPRASSEPPPREVVRLADGVVRVTTDESTDYVFCGVDEPVVFQNDVVDIRAFAGAVRVFKDRVLLVNASGQAGSVGYRGVVAKGLGPFEHAVPVALAKAETLAAGRAIAPLAAPAGEGELIVSDGSGVHANPAVSGKGLKGWIRVNGEAVTYVMAEGFGRIGYQDFYVQGEAPFTLVHEPGKITLTTEGRRRIFQMPIPLNIVPPHLLPPEEALSAEYRHRRDVGGFSNWPWSVDVTVNGVTRMNGWYDGVMAIGLDDGKQEAVITRYTNPPVWRESAWTRMLPWK